MHGGRGEKLWSVLLLSFWGRALQRKVVEPLLGEFKGVVIPFNGTSLAAHEMSCFY